MKLLQRLISVRNQVDFYFRQNIRWGRPLPLSHVIPDRDRRLNAELVSFLQKFPWKEHLKGFSRELVIADIGARNFAFAPAIEKCFAALGHTPEVHGIEIDAYRRLVDFRTRADYGHFFARQIKAGTYHAMDFMDWAKLLDIALLLHPFVTTPPLLNWGLPLSRFSPEKLFRHTHATLKAKRGLLLLSFPTQEERNLGMDLATQTGFRLLAQRGVVPGRNFGSGDPRLGSLWRAQELSPQ